MPETELFRLITYSTRLKDAAQPHVFQVSSGIGPAGPSLTIGGADTEFGMLGDETGNGSSSSNPNVGGTNNGNAGITQCNRGIDSYILLLAISNLIIVDTIPVFFAPQDDDHDNDEDYDGVVVGCDVEQWLMMFAPNNAYNKEMAKRYEAERLHRLQNWLTSVWPFDL